MRRVLKFVPIAIAVVLFGVWFVMFRPTVLGGPATYVVVSGTSMEPTLHGGDLVVLRERDSYGVGDVVSFRIRDGEPGAGHDVIHRIQAEDADGYVTQGDNLDGADPWRPQDSDVSGELWLHAPAAGSWFALLRSPVVIGLLSGIAATYMVYRRPTTTDRREAGSGHADAEPADAPLKDAHA